MSETADTTIRIYPSDRKRIKKRVNARKQSEPQSTAADVIRALLDMTEDQFSRLSLREKVLRVGDEVEPLRELRGA